MPLPSFPRRVLRQVFRRPAEVHARDRKVYFDLIDHLHGDVGSVAGGFIGIMALAWFCHDADPSNGFLGIMAAVGAVGVMRVLCILHYRRHHLGRLTSYRTARLWELIYASGAIGFAALLGAFGVMVISDPKTEDLSVITVAAVVGYAGGIAGRNAGRPLVACAQVAAACLPLVAYLLSYPSGTNFGLACLLIIYMLTLAKIVGGLNEIVSRAFKTERDVGEVNLRLDMAITHMMSGLCMVDRSGRVKILNQRFLSLLDLPGTTYHRLHEVLLSALPRGTLRHAEIGEIQTSLTQGRDLVLKFVTERGQVLLLKAGTTPSGDQILTVDDVTEQTRAAADIERMAKFDTLTGLANRAMILSTLADALAVRPEGVRSRVGVLLLDLDKFKDINDTLGHVAGDQLLVKVGERLRSAAGPEAVVGRLGGDEFVIVVKDMGRRECQALARRLLKVVTKPIKLGANVCKTTASIGIAIGPDHGEDETALIRAADIALYSQKAKGRNGADLFDAEMARQLERRRRLEKDLATAISNGGLDLAFQPIVAAESGRIVAFEALSRWTHPEFGAIPPDVFIELAESTGQIEALGRQVLMKACSEAMNWPSDVRVSVNVSPIQFRDRDTLFADIWHVLTQTGLPASRLDLEVTESVLIDDAEGMLDLIECLRRMDVRVSLDDFGTGYSSLAYVQKYKFDKIKLDKAFADSVETDRTSRATISALANIAKVTGSTLLLEGVETEAQARIAAAHGVNEMQGFLFGKPASAAHTLALFRGKTLQNKAA